MRASTDIASELQRELESGERSSLRYAIRLPISIIANGLEYDAFTENFSSSGALFLLPASLPEGTNLQFFMHVPSNLIGVEGTAAIHGQGRIIRSYEENNQHYAAIVIHEYRFQ
jgi:hypothetical protein